MGGQPGKKIMKSSQKSLLLTREISAKINDQTFHHHYHILYDLPVTGSVTYLEIGCYAGASAILMLQKPDTTVISIDLGRPISKDQVLANVANNNPHNNAFHYIENSSHAPETKQQVLDLVDSVDILFIDGDHSYNAVIKDFYMYESLVKSSGYVVFDDYNDLYHCPEVKSAVDFLVEQTSNYSVIGTIDNVWGARPDTLLSGNCFVLQKK